MSNLDSKTITLNGGVPLVARLTEAREENVIVRQIPLADYERGFALVNDEIALAGFLCGKDKNWALQLMPETFEQVITLGREVNAKGFFAYATRRAVRESEANAAAMAALATLPPETLKLAVQLGADSTSRISSPTSPSPRR